MAKSRTKSKPANSKAKLSDFRPQRENVNLGRPHGLAALDKSIRRDGYSAPMVAAADGEIFAGSKRLERVADIMPGVAPIVVHSDGTRPVIHVRDDIADADDPRAKRLGYADNAIAALDWLVDGEKLAALAASDKDIAELARQENASLKALAEYASGQELADAEPQISRADELKKKWGTELGQLWRIGDHKLLVGDCTVRENVERVLGGEKVRMVWTDPPYGVGYQTKLSVEEAVARHHRRDGLEVPNDNLTEEQTEHFIRSALTNAADVAENGATVYVASPAGTLLPFFIAAFRDTGFVFYHSLAWVKDRFVMGRADYHYRHEIILYGWRKGTHYFVDDRTKDSVFEINRPLSSEYHPTMKPIELVGIMVSNSSRNNEIVYDPFVGSGTTLVACQNLSRRCRAVEISPAYVAVCLERMQTAFPSLEIERL